MSNKFIPYDQVPRETIVQAAKNIKQIPKDKLEYNLIHNLKNYFGDILPKQNLSYNIDTTSLLDIPDSAVIVTFDSDPFSISSDYLISLIGGLARLIYFPNYKFWIPVIYFFKKNASNTIEHEKVHLCQYLQENSFPLTSKQKEIALKYNTLDGARKIYELEGADEAIDFLINFTCYKTWIELEANYVVRDKTDILEWIEKAHKSSIPIYTFDNLCSEFIWWREKGFNKAKTKFPEYLKSMENEVKWLKDFLNVDKSTSLHSILISEHNELISDLMFGPIDENAFDDIDDPDCGPIDENDLNNKDIDKDSFEMKEYTDKEFEEMKELYAMYGHVMLEAQCLEWSIAMLIIIRKRKDRKDTSKAELDWIYAMNFEKSLSSLISSLKKSMNLFWNLEKDLTQLLKIRNNLAHNYFKINSDDFNTSEGRGKRIYELVEFIKKFQKVNNKLLSLVISASKKYGYSENDITVELTNITGPEYKK